LKVSTFHAASASLSILLNLARPDDPIMFDYREANNDQWSFVDFILRCCIHRALIAGDYLIFDNAVIHKAQESAEVLRIILDFFQFTIVYLPKYSPGLNPCELVFSYLKGLVRQNRSYDLHVAAQILYVVASIPYQCLVNWYGKCIFPNFVLPDLFVLNT
jgi:hypothetical protein